MVFIVESAMVLALLVSIVLPKIKICKSGEYHEDYLSLDNTKSLRGLMAVLIVLHHLSAYYTQLSFLSPFQHIGYIVVAGFFFLSGYGLFYGFERKQNYLNKFLLKRLPSIVLPYYIATLFYALVYFLIKIDFNIKDFFLSFVGVNCIVPGSWYIVMQVMMYIVFYIAFSLTKNKSFKNQMIAFSILFVAVFVAFLFADSDLYTRSIFAFPLGILWCNYKDKIESVLKKHYMAFFLIIAVLQIVTFGLKFAGEMIDIKNVSFVGSILSSAIFPLFTMIILMKVKVQNKILDFLGGISLEIYLLHNIVLTLLKKVDFVLNNSLLFVSFTIIAVVCISIVFKKINSFLVPKVVKILTK